MHSESIYQGKFAGQQAKYEIHNAQARPDLWDMMKDPKHPLNAAWPAFIDHDLTFEAYKPKLVEYKGLARYQFVATERAADGTISVVACAYSVPFFWPELCQADDHNNGVDNGQPRARDDRDVLQTLPDGGYDTILSRGVRQYLTRTGLPGASRCFTKDQEQDTPVCRRTEAPNALSATSVTVQLNRRGTGLAEALIETMKATARQERLQILVVPLRPTRKTNFPFVTMQEYIAWQDPVKSSISSSCHGKENHQSDRTASDPWLRKHLRLGGKIVKVAPRSMIIHGSRENFRQWTGQDPAPLVCRQGDSACVEVPFPGGLVPLVYHVDEGMGVYVEPNVWVYHSLGEDSVSPSF